MGMVHAWVEQITVLDVTFCITVLQIGASMETPDTHSRLAVTG